MNRLNMFSLNSYVLLNKNHFSWSLKAVLEEVHGEQTQNVCSNLMMHS